MPCYLTTFSVLPFHPMLYVLCIYGRSCTPSIVSMNRSWNILCWNIRGINSEGKWDALRNKIDESACTFFCLQETKKEWFDVQFVRKFSPKCFDKLDYVPSIGASAGILVGWSSSILEGMVIQKTHWAITISFTSKHNSDKWFISSVYGTCLEPKRTDFITWMKNLVIQDDEN